MNMFSQIAPLKNPSDLTEKNLNNLFGKYFDDQTLSLEILDEDQKFLEDNDNFQSLIRKCHLRIKSQRNDLNREFSVIVKTSLQYEYKTKLVKIHNLNIRSGGGLFTGVSRTFFTETFWYKYAQPVLQRTFPELGQISPRLYYAYSNYEDSYRPDWCDNNCSIMCRAVHHKREKGLILLENISEQERFDGRKQMRQVDKSKMLSKNQVATALRALGTFHGAWWVWLRREKNKAEPEEFVQSPMNLEDVENTFIKLRNTGESLMKPFFAKFHKYLLRLLKHSGCEEDLIARVGVAIKTPFWEQAIRENFI